MLRVRGLTMRYPNGKLALAGFDLNVEAGELVVVLGGNGSGKTTLLRCISRMLRPTAGEILLSSTDLTKLSGERLRQARLPLAMIWQQASLVRRRSVLSNVAAGALGRYGGLWTALGGLPAVERRAAYDELRRSSSERKSRNKAARRGNRKKLIAALRLRQGRGPDAPSMYAAEKIGFFRRALSMLLQRPV